MMTALWGAFIISIVVYCVSNWFYLILPRAKLRDGLKLDRSDQKGIIKGSKKAAKTIQASMYAVLPSKEKVLKIVYPNVKRGRSKPTK